EIAGVGGGVQPDLDGGRLGHDSLPAVARNACRGAPPRTPKSETALLRGITRLSRYGPPPLRPCARPPGSRSGGDACRSDVGHEAVVMIEGYRPRRVPVSPRIGEDRLDLGEDDPGDMGMRQRSGRREIHPLQAAELAAGAGEILRIAAERGGMGEEEARVEAARAPRRRYRPEDETQTRPVRPDPRLQHRAQRLRRARSKRRRPRIGPAEREARFLPEFTGRGEREGAAPPGRSLDRE